MSRHILYIINPISGVGSKGLLQSLVETRTKEAGIAFSIYPSVASGDYQFLKDIIREKKVTDVVIAGGDGTINQVVNALRKEDVSFGILPAGSGNGLAFTAGIPKNHNKALDIVFAGKAEWTDAFMINNSFACMLCGLGFDAQVAHDFAKDPNRGLTTYIKKTVSNFFIAKPYPFSITINEKTMDTVAYFISIANSNQFGNHFTIAPKASLKDGNLDIVIMTKQNKLSVLFQTLFQVGGFHNLQEMDVLKSDASVLYFQTKSITIHNQEMAPMHLDGDPVETKAIIEASILPSCFRLIYP
ncbi:MAG TPA: YegS/Rv2252/BmrU family lipid kinase [Chitinophagaceae bacterium]